MLNYLRQLPGLKSVVKSVMALGQVSLMTGLAIAGMQPTSQATEIAAVSQSATSHSVVSRTVAREAKLANGVYLYGQAPQPDQIGHTYLVFEVTNGKVVGVMYMPHSSFDCFQGNLQPDRLAFSLVDSYTRKTYAASIPLETSPLVASASDVSVAGVRLQGFHPIQTLATNDQRMLNICKADFQN